MDILDPAFTWPDEPDEDDYKYYYVNIFVDRDMYMRYHGGGIGHYHLTIPDDSEADSASISESQSSKSENTDTGASDGGTGTDSDADTTSDDEEDFGEQVPEENDDFNDEENTLAKNDSSTITPNTTPTPTTRTLTLTSSAATVTEGSPPVGSHNLNTLSHVHTVPPRMNSDQLRMQLAKFLALDDLRDHDSVLKALVVERTQRLCTELARDANKSEMRQLQRKLHLVKKEHRGFKVMVDTHADTLMQVSSIATASTDTPELETQGSDAKGVMLAQPDIRQWAVWLKEDVKKGMGIWGDRDAPEDTEESNEPDSTDNDSDDEWDMWVNY
ncbi:hypothetical protein EYR36_012033 [Pleurotus pulmonarius]|nr:hypothetical protein EYR36_012033 [Pleurotus pulmonarius]